MIVKKKKLNIKKLFNFIIVTVQLV